MGVVEEFAQSGELGFDVSKGYFWVQMLEELPNFPDVALVAQGDRMVLINRNYVKIRIVKEEENGSAIE